jgi:splicing factor 1
MPVNTREDRWRQKLDAERRQLIEEACQADPTYRHAIHNAAASGLPSVATFAPLSATVGGGGGGGRRVFDKMYLPANEFPDINFMGLIIGPRGNTLKRIEADTGAKISIRGRGTEKPGHRGMPMPGMV